MMSNPTTPPVDELFFVQYKTKQSKLDKLFGGKVQLKFKRIKEKWA